MGEIVTQGVDKEDGAKPVFVNRVAPSIMILVWRSSIDPIMLLMGIVFDWIDADASDH